MRSQVVFDHTHDLAPANERVCSDVSLEGPVAQLKEALFFEVALSCLFKAKLSLGRVDLNLFCFHSLSSAFELNVQVFFLCHCNAALMKN